MTHGGEGRRDLYVMFLDRSVLVGSLQHDPETFAETQTYSYFYGAGLKR